VEPSVDDWDDVAAVVGFVPRVDLVVAAAVDTVVRAVEVALVALDKAVVVVLLGAGFDLLSLFLLLIIVDILWE
jgi:hypothetical protein